MGEDVGEEEESFGLVEAGLVGLQLVGKVVASQRGLKVAFKPLEVAVAGDAKWWLVAGGDPAKR